MSYLEYDDIIKKGTHEELELLEDLIEFIDGELKELTADKAEFMKRCEELRKDLYDEWIETIKWRSI